MRWLIRERESERETVHLFQPHRADQMPDPHQGQCHVRWIYLHVLTSVGATQYQHEMDEDLSLNIIQQCMECYRHSKASSRHAKARMTKQPSVPMSFACCVGSFDRSSLHTSFASMACALNSSRGASTSSSFGNPLALSHVICRECALHGLKHTSGWVHWSHKHHKVRALGA